MEQVIIAQELLLAYSLTAPEIEFIRHNENMVFKVTDQADGKCYLLRVHIPATDGFSGIQHTLAGIQSEMTLLQELYNCNFIAVQQPIANSYGSYVTEYQADEHSAPCYASLLVWIDGPTLSFEESNKLNAAYALGEMLADFHNASCQIQSAGQLIRPQYDVERIDSAIHDLQIGVEYKLYTAQQYEIIKEVLQLIKSEINILEQREAAKGIIHADLQLGNVIIHNERLHLIDFSLAGFGYYLFDIGSASYIVPSELRSKLLAGYSSRRSFTDADLRYVEAFMLMDAFISYMFFIHDEQRNGWIKTHADDVCATLCQDFLAGKPVYFSLH